MPQHIAQNVLELIGRTPLVRLNRLPPPGGAQILAKLESMNPGGSVKDRTCLSMIEDAEGRGILKPGATIIEPTSGNTGIGLAMIGAVKGYHVILTMPDVISTERIFILKGYGAEVVLTPPDEGMTGAVKKAEEVLKEHPGAFMPQQFKNPTNPAVHRRTTAEEIWKDTGGKLDAVVAGVGTGGTVTGVGEVLKKYNPAIRVFAVEPKGSPVLSGGESGMHLIQGIGAGFVPDVLNRGVIDEILTVTDDEAYETSRRLAREEGIFVGLSAGAACSAALAVSRRLGAGKIAVVILPDTGERYMSAATYWER